MRILHCCLSCFYIDNFGYQENILPRINHEDGHDMLIIASTETYKNGSLCYSNPSEYRTEYGVKIIRLPYARWLPSKIGKKLRIMSGFKKALYGFNPDVILFHGSCGYEIVTVAEYRAAHPDTKLYVDSHEAFYNSAKNWVSKNILHGVFYRTWFRKALPKIDKVLYIGLHEKYYMRDFMHTPEVKLEYFPLGGEIISEKEKKTIRSEIRANHGINENTMVFIHTGKLNPLKKTIELMHAFSTYKDGNALLLIIGVVSPKMEDEFNARLKEDRRIRFLGWKTVEEMKSFICAADMYLQPGSPSATMQTAICCGTPGLISDTDFHRVFIESGCSVSIKTEDDIFSFFRKNIDPTHLRNMSHHAYRIARELLDYRKLAARLYR